MKLHEFEMYEIEFSQLFFRFKQSIEVESDPALSVGDLVIIHECVFKSNRKTGRILTFSIKSIDQKNEAHPELMIWTLHLKQEVFNEHRMRELLMTL